MIKQVEGFDKYIVVAGFRDVNIGDVNHFLSGVREKFADVTVQFFDATLIAGWQHLYFATLNALKAFQNQTNISKNLAVECLLYASALRQIKNAMELIGITKNMSKIALLIVADRANVAEKSFAEVSKLISGKRDDTILELSSEKVPCIKQLFNISEKELATMLDTDEEEKALSDLVIEHIALLVTQR